MIIAATALLQACAPPSSSPPSPQALQVCADNSGRRVEDWRCRGAAADNPYLWYFFDGGGPVPPLGDALVGGSPIATNGVAYGIAAGGDRLAPRAERETPQNSPSETVVTRDAGGAFVVGGAVNGHPVTFVVDTGASDVVLSPEDARNLGLEPNTLHYDRVYQTANGAGRGASFQADEISIGAIRILDVAASVNQAPMRYSLLGRTFLDRLNSFRVERGRLYLK